MAIVRTLLFVPGNNQRFIDKARALNADIVCLDLEDSVPSNEKVNARVLVKNALNDEFESYVYVRVNSFDSNLIYDDIKAVISDRLSGIVIPKVNTADEVKQISAWLDGLEDTRRIELIPSIESAKGVVNAYSIASASDRVIALVFGVFDFLHDLGLEYRPESIAYSYARAKIPVDARAAGVDAIDAIWQSVDDIDGLVRDAMVAKELGYKGKSIIHPKQIDPVHNVFLPSKEEVEWARKVIDALDEAMRVGRGAVRVDGRMVDAVHYKRAKAILGAVKG
jgi:citrate lyase subunit beta/citryl-CoA lyase